MLFRNNSKYTYVFYDKLGRKYVVKPSEIVEDSLIPEVFNMSTFVPHGMKRTPRLRDGGTPNGN